MGSVIAAGTSYATHGEPMIPIYIFYSMFGFQRTGDSMWAFADQLGRGFLLGATAGRTTLNGEGLQHEDGHSILLASTNPAAVAYDPSWAYEISYITKDALQRMYGSTTEHPNGENVFYYLTLRNERIPAGEPEVGRRRFAARSLATSRRPPRRTGPRRRFRVRSAMQWALPPRNCSQRTGASQRTSGRRPPGPSCGARLCPATNGTSSTRGNSLGCRTSPGPCPTHRDPSSRSATSCGRCRIRSRPGSRATMRRSGPTASAGPTHAAHCGGISTSTGVDHRRRNSSPLAERGEIPPGDRRDAVDKYQPRPWLPFAAKQAARPIGFA